jgi:hypothetical protein
VISRTVLEEEVGLDAQDVHAVETGDDTLDLSPKEPQWAGHGPRLVEIIQSGSFFAVQWRGTDYTKDVAGTAALVGLVEAIEHLHERTGFVPVFTPMSWEPKGDVVAAIRMWDLVGDRFPFHVVWQPLRASEMKWVLGRANFGIGHSYHFNVFLLSQGIPSIGLYTNEYYKVKLQGAFRALGCGLEPMPYSAALRSDRAFLERADQAIGWTESMRQEAISAASEQREQWHRTWRQFMSASARP